MSPEGTTVAPATLLAVLLGVAAAISFVNVRFLRLPAAIGMLLGGLALSGVVAALSALGLGLAREVETAVAGVPFGRVVFEWMLGFLLFAGALQIDIREFFRERLTIVLMSVGTTLLTLVLLGAGAYYLLALLHEPLSWAQALLLGAIIAPTDPAAALTLLRQAGVPKRLEALIAGESLFNDGVGVVAFTVLVAVADPARANPSVGMDLLLFLREMLGGLLLGAFAGAFTAFFQRQARDESTALFLSLALVTCGYALAEAIGVSAPVTVAASAVALSALNHRRRARARQHGSLSKEAERARMRLRTFWDFIDQILNALLFLLMALELLVLHYSVQLLIISAAIVLLTLLARAVGVWLPLTLLQRSPHRAFPRYTRRLVLWSGLRGGVALALAFNLEPGGLRDLLLGVSYAVVLFSVLVQGLTLPLIAKKAARANDELEAAEKRDREAGEQGQGEQAAAG